MRAATFCYLLLTGVCVPIFARENTDLEALNTADNAQAAPEHASDWRVLIESAFGDTAQRYGLQPYRTKRVSADVALDKTLVPRWRLIFADRLDWN